jgi:calcium-dependent protein kinase
MGILCENCENKNNDDSDSQKSNSKTGSKQEIFALPKQYVSETIQEEKKLNMEIFNKKKEENDNNKKTFNKKSYSKAKTILNPNSCKDIKNKAYLSKLSKIVDRSNSLNISEEKKTTIINKEMDNLENRLSLKFMKRRLSKSEMVTEKPKQKMQIFTRRKKKSTTLMENNQVINNLRKIQMSVPLSQELLVPKRKGNPSEKYIIGKKMGSGTYGTVYEATNIIFKSKVAMKRIIKEDNMNSVLINNEIDILKKMSHPNIVRIYEFYESINCFYLINEYCSQGELYNYINRSTLNEQQLSIIFYQVFSGLCYLHENNVLHRDIKPENILISKKEKDLNSDEIYFWIKIIDFGTAKIFEKGEKERKIVGSAYYIAPEVLNQDYNEKCDTWSVGVILYMFLVGRAPFDGKNHEEIINSIRTKNYDENNPRLLMRSPEVRDLVNNLLNKNIERRFSAKEALNHEWFKKFDGRKLFGNFLKEEIEPFITNLFNYTYNSKIQQLVIAFLVHNMPTTDKFDNILKIYRYFNELGDCKLTKEELIKGLSKYRNKLEVIKKVDLLFSLLDGDNNGFIEYEEFLRACVDKKEILTESNLKYAFKFLDHNNSGKLNVDKIAFAFMNQENKMFEIAISKDISDVDGDGDGQITFNEFKKLMFNNIS